MAEIKEGPELTNSTVTRLTARIGERVTVQLKPGQLHPAERTDRLGGQIISWGPRGLSVRRIATQRLVYILNSTIETVISQQR